jgi:hypothetical protein
MWPQWGTIALAGTANIAIAESRAASPARTAREQSFLSRPLQEILSNEGHPDLLSVPHLPHIIISSKAESRAMRRGTLYRYGAPP